MKKPKYRVEEKNGVFYPQEKVLWGYEYFRERHEDPLWEQPEYSTIAEFGRYNWVKKHFPTIDEAWEYIRYRTGCDKKMMSNGESKFHYLNQL